MNSSVFELPRNFLMLCGVSLATVSSLYLRNYIVGNHVYNFLLWNLFLGFVPLLFAWIVQRYYKRFGLWFLVIGSGLWLLFYPNAPYMISDFIHVDQHESYVLYDALLIFALAMLSTFFGLYSLHIIRAVIKSEKGLVIANMVAGACIMLAAFGVYLGRVLRLNSWDLFTEPVKTIEMIFSHLFPISENPQTWILIIIFSALQVFLLLLIRGMSNHQQMISS